MPALVDGVALLATLFAAVLCWMLLVGYQLSLGALLRAIASVADSVSLFGWHPFRVLGSLAHQVDQYLNAVLVDAVNGTRWAFAKVLNFTALLIEKSFEAVAELAEATYSSIAHTVEHVIPEIVAGAIKPVWGAVHSLSHQLAYLWRVVTALAQKIDHALVIPAEKIVIQLPKTAKHEATKAVKVATGAYADVLPRVRGLERDLHGIDETLKDTLRKVTPAGLAGLLIGSVLAKMGLTWLRCSNVNRVGRSVCGLNANVLEGLLAGLLSIFGTIGIVTFAKDVQKVVGDFGGEIGHFWRADVIGAGGDRALGSPGLQ